MKKRTISFLLVTLLIINILPITTQALSSGWGTWADGVDVSTVVSYRVPGGYIYFGQYSAYSDSDSFSENEKAHTIRLIASDETITSVVIPSEINGLNVKYFDTGVFSDCDQLASVTIPKTVVTIGGWPFLRSENVSEITVEEGNPSFYVKNKGLYETVEYVDHNNNNINELHLRFYFGKESNTCQITKGTTHINSYAFTSVDFSEIYLPDSIREIDTAAFSRYSGQLDIFYAGSKAQWDRVDKRCKDPIFVNANIHFNNAGSEMEPPSDNNGALSGSSEILGTYTTDLIMPAADLGVSAPDSVLRATLTFTEDGKATATWEAVDLTAFKVFFHDMFVSSYYAMAYGAGITDIQQIEQLCMASTGLSVSAYMDTIVTDEAMRAAFTPPSTQGTYRYAPENKAIFTDLALMDVPSDPNVPNSFTVENGTMHLNAASYGKPDYTFVCKK